MGWGREIPGNPKPADFHPKNPRNSARISPLPSHSAGFFSPHQNSLLNQFLKHKLIFFDFFLHFFPPKTKDFSLISNPRSQKKFKILPQVFKSQPPKHPARGELFISLFPPFLKN